MKIHPPITPAALRTRYHEQPAHRPEAVAPGPPLAFDDGEATAAWLTHIDAGRIKVR